jgi:hypothetical protein
MGSPEQAGVVNMIPTTWKLGASWAGCNAKPQLIPIFALRDGLDDMRLRREGLECWFSGEIDIRVDKRKCKLLSEFSRSEPALRGTMDPVCKG